MVRKERRRPPASWAPPALRPASACSSCGWRVRERPLAPRDCPALAAAWQTRPTLSARLCSVPRSRSLEQLLAGGARAATPPFSARPGRLGACLPACLLAARASSARKGAETRGRAGEALDSPCAAARCDLRDLNPAPLRAEGPARRGGASDGASPPPARRTARRRPLTQGRQPAAVGLWPTNSQTASSAATLRRRGNPAGHVLSASL